jgi:hypothetical protein
MGRKATRTSLKNELLARESISHTIPSVAQL